MFRHIAIATLALSAAGAAALPVKAREVVGLRDGRFDPGTIVIHTGERKLYYVVSPGEAIRYTIAVGKAGKQWRGVKYVEEMQGRGDAGRSGLGAASRGQARQSPPA